MRAIIPDTLEGALLLSIIDFFLSFIIIAGIGVVLSFFPLLNRFVPKITADSYDGDNGQDLRHVPEASASAVAIDANHLVAISASIHAVMGPHRITRIETDRSPQ
jgi:hypothetical protein